MSSSFSGIFQSNAGYVEEVFDKYVADPQSVSSEWRAYFEGFHEGFGLATKALGSSFESAQVGGTPRMPADGSSHSLGAGDASDVAFELGCASLVMAYKSYGHLQAKTDPLGFERPKPAALLPETHGLPGSTLTRTTRAGVLAGLAGQQEGHTLHELIAALDALYCRTVGVEFDHVADPNERAWLHAQVPRFSLAPSAQTKRHLFTELAKADALEKTIGTKFIGKKRFSIEGADAQIVAIETLMDTSVQAGATEICLGMAHRGRLNTLVHCASKPLEQLFAEFEGYPSAAVPGDWDVKYHSGWEAERTTRSGTPFRVALSFNPSHLEFVNAVTLGETRARQQRYHASDVSKVVPIVLHGDAAFAGQGVVFETMQMMNLHGYTVGGTVHVVANNQVGFTTNPFDARSSAYCTDVAKVVGAPVFHVNADDIHAVHAVATVCAEYRAKFGKDVVIDLVCFRRHGHNEADEPRFTQPVLYRVIESKKPPYEAYMHTLASSFAHEGFSEESLKAEYDALRASMNAVFDKVRAEHTAIAPMPNSRAKVTLRAILPGSAEADILEPIHTGVDGARLRTVGAVLSAVPESFTANSKLARIILGERKEMLEARKRIDWGFGELLAYGTLLQEGFTVRLAGQDARRGTFSHRHGTLVDANTGAFFTPLSAVAAQDARIDIVDSLLSEAGAMGFDYGFSVQHDKALALWEGQFGDFANGAQVIIDQFLVSGESKWCQTSGLVLLLPHGYEGQGPEHSSARMERFLSLYAQGNIQVCYFTNVAQLFHALRRQVLRPFRKPLVIMTPKSFVRSPRASASFEDLENGRLYELLDDPRFASGQVSGQVAALDTSKVKKVVLCTGKVALDLFDTLDKEEHAARAKEIAIVRVEQLAPFHEVLAVSLLKRYGKATEIVWCQEEPANMGAWTFLWPRLQAALRAAGHKTDLAYVGRSERASPAVGLEKQHFIEQEKILTHAVAGKGSLRV